MWFSRKIRTGHESDYEISIMEAKELPDFTDTDNNFVSLTLNGLIIDKKCSKFCRVCLVEKYKF